VEDQNPTPTAVQTPTRSNSRVAMAFLLVFALMGVGAALLMYFSPHFFVHEAQADTHPHLKVGGTSTVFVIVDNRWRTKYRDEKGVEVNYESTGTTSGINRMLDGTYAIAFTHGPVTAEQREKAKAKGSDVVHIPVLLCGVAVVYNVKELNGKEPVKLSGELLADIFAGKVKEWNDPTIKALNSGVDLPATKITVVHREDSSGTTQLFTEYLATVSPSWKEKVGAPASEIKWPVGVGALRNLGVAMKVSETEGAIGYVDRMFTNYGEINLNAAAILNKDKTGFIRPEPENVTAAAAGNLAEVSDELTFTLANKAGKDSYPISGVVYAVYLQKQPEVTRQQIADFLRWATHDGQPHAARMTYAPLPPELVVRINQKLDAMKAAK
jgi:phosphate transport system substrate-binding protein